MKAAHEASYLEFVEARQTHLRRMAYAISGDWSKAEDLLQTALVKLYGAWPRMNRRGTEEAYVRQIMVRAAIDESRRPWRRERIDSDLAHADREGRTGTPLEERSELVEALQRLPEMQRKVVVLRHLYDLSIAETAQELGISPGTVKSHGSRGLENLRVALGDPSVALPG